MLSHADKHINNPLILLRDPIQTTLKFTSGECGSLGATSTRFTVEACRKALAMFLILDEQPFMIVEGENLRTFKHS